MASALQSDIGMIHKSLDTLKPNPRNPRTHSKKQIKMIAG